jgi:hypothetical protein
MTVTTTTANNQTFLGKYESMKEAAQNRIFICPSEKLKKKKEKETNSQGELTGIGGWKKRDPSN